jgi:dTDP-4-amino-4,6-dideoxygalactose transaminase
MTKNNPPLVPMSAPDITDAERQAVMDVLYTPNLSMGAQIDAFESAIAEFSGVKNAIAVNSGTAGLHLCVRAAGIGQDDLVITTPFSFIASTNVLLFEKAIPVFVDVDPVTGNIDPLKVANAVRELKEGGAAAKHWLPRKGAEHAGPLKGLLAVDVFGQPADYEALRKITDDAKIPLIEDSCEALGAEYKGRKAGGQGDFGVFAFYPNKQITTGEGGIIVTDDDKAANFMRALRSQGRAPGDTWLQHTYMGYNYRMDEMSAALGRVQMKRIEELLNKRQQVADWYAERLSEIHGIEAPQLVESTSRVSWFVYVVRFDASLNRDKIAAELVSLGIPVRPYFIPIHLQPYLVEQFGYRPGDYPVTEDLGKRGLALPFSGKMTEAQVETVCQMLRQCIDHNS